MGVKISYSDGVFLNACRSIIASRDFSDEARMRLAEKLTGKSGKTRRKANGRLKLPEGRAEFLDMLDILAAMLSLGTDANIICEAIDDYIYRLDMVEKRCKVVFLVQEKTVWPSLESIYKAMEADDRFDPKLVNVPFTHVNKQQDDEVMFYRECGLNVLHDTEYDMSRDNPDVVFFAKPYGSVPMKYYIREIEKIVERTVYVPYGMEINYDLIRYAFQYYLHYRAWRHIVYGDIVRRVGADCGFRNAENIVVWGHPRADSYPLGKKYAVPDEWKAKIGNRKVILWCPHHTIVPGPEYVSTYLEFSDTVFREMDRRSKDAALLWRPHPMLFGALVNNHHMTQEEMDRFIAQKAGQENVILDTSSDYRTAFAASDGMIADGTTFSVEYLFTGKPMMLTTKNLNRFYNADALEKGVYIGRTPDDITTFMDILIRGDDPKKSEREALSRDMFFRPKGKTVGENIAEHIISDINAERIAI